MSRKITIIISSDNKRSFRKDCLPSLKLHTDYDNYEVIVAANDADDDTAAYFRSLAWIKYLETPPGATRAAGLSAAEQQAAGDIVLLADDVLISEAGWLRRLQQAAYTDNRIGVVGCRLVDENGVLLHAGGYMLVPEYRQENTAAGEKDINQLSSRREVEAVDGFCLYIKRDLIEKIGWLDEELTVEFDVADFCRRTRQAGFKVFYEGGLTLTRLALPKIRPWPERSVPELYQRARQKFISKWSNDFADYYETAVMWHSIIGINIGYAVTSRSLILALDEEKVDVRYGFVYGVDEHPSAHPKLNNIRRRPKDIDMTQVVYGQGNVFYKNSGKGFRIGYTMLEVSGIPGDWVNQANMLDEIWVPSHFNLETFKASGVKRPIKVMQLGIDPEYFNPNIKSFFRPEAFVFLSVFEWGERKAPELLIRVFNQEFSADDDVVLLLKIFNYDPGVDVVAEINKLKLYKDRRAPILVLLNKSIPDYQMGSLYRGSDCFVLPTRGEGWGMPILEAMACGLPVICTDWGAQTEFITPDNCYPLQAKKLIPAKARCPYYEGFQWAEPDGEHLRYLMRYVYEHRREAAAKGQRAAAEAAAKWTWRAAGRRIKQRLLEIGK